MLKKVIFSCCCLFCFYPLLQAQDKKVVSAGAIVPFITYEAEAAANRTNGKTVHLINLETDIITPEMEASGRAFIALEKTGDYLEILSKGKANALLVRFCTPDGADGGGMDATLSLYVNNVKRQTLVFNSRHAWLYGSKDVKPAVANPNAPKENKASDEKWEYGRVDANGQSNDPHAGPPHVYWDEAAFLLNTPLKKGDRLKLQREATDNAAFYRIDLVELEQADKALAPPTAGSYLSIVDFGATGNDTTDDTRAISDCIAACKQSGKTVWMPAGTFYQTQRFVLDGVKLKGAGMWHTKLLATVEGDNWAGNAGFNLKGSGAVVSDLYIASPAHTRRSTGGKFFTGNPDHWSVKNVWMQYGLCGFWMTGATDGEISNCRVRNTYADGINVNDGSENVLVINNHVRGVGDDGIAVLSQLKKNKLTAHITVRNNTITANWWGHNIDLAGGYGHLIDGNYMADNAVSGCFTINLPAAYPMHPLRRSTISNNLIERGGGDRIGMQKRGAVWLYAGSTSVDSVSFVHNAILHSVFRAIHITGGEEQHLIFKQNTINDMTLDAVFIEPAAKGSAQFRNNSIMGVKQGFTSVKNASEVFHVSNSVAGAIILDSLVVPGYQK